MPTLLQRIIKSVPLLLLLAFYSATSLAKTGLYHDLLLPKNIDTTSLSGQESYALFSLDVQSAAPSFKIVKLATRRGEVSYQKGKPKPTTSKMQVNLKGLKNDLYLLALPPGLYQITEVTSPSYNLPYRLTTDFSEGWRFEVVENSVSYAGAMFINAERSKNFVDIQLQNHFATDYQKINAVMAQLPKTLVLHIGKQPHDDFYDAFLQE